MVERYFTIKKESVAEVIEKKSRFIATARPIKDEEEAKEFIENIKKKYWDARHNAFAYQIGGQNEIQRFSDDGEPQGTAGMPILNVLIGNNLKNTIVVVTRYFGGTLLGTGGLVRSYGKAAKEAVISCEIVEKLFCEKISVLTEYKMSGKVQYEILQENYFLIDSVYSDMVEFIVLIPISFSQKFKKQIIDVTSAEVEISEIGKYYCITENGKVVSYE